MLPYRRYSHTIIQVGSKELFSWHALYELGLQGCDLEVQQREYLCGALTGLFGVCNTVHQCFTI